ncbi:MAG: hypothetical protein H7A24_03495 [Leptospiraceae bacterium]|nr:hypothetical protein [Leptospiraceae bacterium]MCP5510915.1 hypothetical protein [Leptospiraceae bacterium]
MNILARIQKDLDPGGTSLFRRPEYRYMGKAVGDSFHMFKNYGILDQKNVQLIALGKISHEPAGTRIEVNLRLKLYMYFTIVFWMLISLGFFPITLLAYYLINKSFRSEAEDFRAYFENVFDVHKGSDDDAKKEDPFDRF